MKIAPYWKAVAGFLAPGFGLFVAAVSDGSVTQAEWTRIITACVAGALGVYLAPKNKQPRPVAGNRGSVDLLLLLVLATFVLVLLLFLGVHAR